MKSNLEIAETVASQIEQYLNAREAVRTGAPRYVLDNARGFLVIALEMMVNEMPSADA